MQCQVNFFEDDSSKSKSTHSIPTPTSKLTLRKPEEEIVSCITALGVPFQLEELRKPYPQKIQSIFEMFAETAMGIRKESALLVLLAGSAEFEFPDTHKDSLLIASFFGTLQKLMLACEVDDFSMADLTKPETSRLIRIFSALINFTMYMQQKMDTAPDYLKTVEDQQQRIEQLTWENENLRSRLEEQKARRAGEVVPKRKKMEKFNNDLIEKLRALKDQESTLTNEFDKLKQEKKSVAQELSQNTYLLTVGRQECNKIRSYIVGSPEKYQSTLAELSTSLQTQKSVVDIAGRKVAALKTSAVSIDIVLEDVEACIKVMEECQADLKLEQETAKKMARQLEILAQKKTQVQELERREAQLTRQLQNGQEKVLRINQKAEEKRIMAQEKLNKLNATYHELNLQRDERTKEEESVRLQVDAIKRKIEYVKNEYEEEYNAAKAEMGRLTAHVNSYIDEMEPII
ncbi:kinetochore-associated Ndc80 complex subunit nuf2 [Rhizina undulata]